MSLFSHLQGLNSEVTIKQWRRHSINQQENVKERKLLGTSTHTNFRLPIQSLEKIKLSAWIIWVTSHENLKEWLFIQHINRTGVYRGYKVQVLNMNTPHKVWSLHFFLFTTIPKAPMIPPKPCYRRQRNFLVYTSQEQLLSVVQTEFLWLWPPLWQWRKASYMLAVCPCTKQCS